jgi:hypothetical protein
MPTKKIILGYRTPFLHGKLGKPGSHGGAGLGDILRGMLSVTEYCKGRDVEIEYCFTNHPISNWLKGTKGRTNYVFEDFTTHILKSWENCYCALERFLNHPNYDTIYIESTMLPIQLVNAEQSQDFYRKEYFSDSTIEAVQNSLTFNDDFLADVNTILNSYSINSTFSVLHIRLQDYNFVDFEDTLGLPMSKVFEKVKRLSFNKETTIFMSTSRKLLHILKKKLGVHVRDTDAIHLGNFNDTTEELKQRIKDTLIDFVILSKASHIIQLSDYHWGSGFSDSCATLYNIPIEKHLLSND